MEHARREARKASPERRRHGCGRAQGLHHARHSHLPVAVVTGASSGIGAAIARGLTAAGWSCVLLARREERLRAIGDELGAEWHVCDVRDRDEVERVAAEVRGRHPAIGLLVNNAGIPGRADFLTIDPERLEDVVRTNYLGGVWCLRAFLPALEAADGADVVNIVSIAGFVSFPPAGPYSASKHAQLAFSRATAGELAGRGIRVHTVSPGMIETEGFPQRSSLGSALARRLVVGPERVASHVLSVLEHDRRETFVPGWYRLGALAQGVVPGLLARQLRRRPSRG